MIVGRVGNMNNDMGTQGKDSINKTKVDKQFGRFMTLVKNLEVTVPFTNLISQVPS